jgi:hypothetical protein
MKASKLIVLAGGILGILAFFLPLVSVQRDNFHGTVSAFQLVKGLDAASDAVDKADSHVDSHLDSQVDSQVNVASFGAEDAAASHAAAGEAKKDLGALKAIVLAIFAPALVLALIGGLGVKRKRFGRGAGALSLVLGLVGLGIAMILKSAAEGDAGIGLTLLLVTGVSGVVGGMIALIKPQRLAVAA